MPLTLIELNSICTLPGRLSVSGVHSSTRGIPSLTLLFPRMSPATFSASTSFHLGLLPLLGFPGSSVVKNPPANVGDTSSIPGSGRFTEKEMAIHSCILAWEIPWTEEPGGLQSTGLQRVRTKQLGITKIQGGLLNISQLVN